MLLGAFLLVVGFLAPLVETSQGDRSTIHSGMQAAQTVAVNFWIVPCVALALFSVILRRRTPLGMRGARVLVPSLATIAGVSLTLTTFRIREGAAEVSERTLYPVEVAFQLGTWIVAVGVILAFVGGLRLGVLPRRRRDPIPVDDA